MLNYLPIIGQAAQLAAEVIYSSASDYFGKRLPFLLVHSVSEYRLILARNSSNNDRLSILRPWLFSSSGPRTNNCTWLAGT